MITLLLATRNAHKVREICQILGDTFRCSTLDDFPGAPSVIEDAGSLVGNATKKALELATWLSRSCITNASHIGHILADDSGLEVDALNGAPGVHSARFAALDTGAPGNSLDAENRSKLLRLMKDVPLEKRSARFRCVLALTPVIWREDKRASPVCCANESELQTELFEGACEGRIGFTSQGHGGFGYDPLFIPVGHETTFAELQEGVKNRLSHRAIALEKLKRRFEGFGGSLKPS